MLPSSMADQASVMLIAQSSSSSSASSRSSLLACATESSGDQTEISPPHSPTGKTSFTRKQLCPGLLKPMCPMGELTPQDATVSLHARPSALAADEGGYEADLESHEASSVSGVARPKPVRGESKGRKRAQSLQSRHPLGTTSLANEASPDPQVGHKDTHSGPAQTRHAVRPNAIDLKAIPEYEFEPKVVKAAVGLGLGLPSDHHVKTPRSSTMPHFPSPSMLHLPEQNLLPSRPFPSPISESEVRRDLRLRPTILADSPSPIELLPPRMPCYEPRRQEFDLISDSQAAEVLTGSASLSQTSPFFWTLSASLCDPPGDGAHGQFGENGAMCAASVRSSSIEVGASNQRCPSALV
ncbi:hypothetical protein BV22DRAFT_230673 [Leucogyrophana mollusca]|uniref:Uncharacterized protein n=1 Tax=Leucogyrophana mollusca TaxID=85980 RepID=A0ACB8BQA2_9AGAM|nr:hypothetical protein BV22DRAFT_230673 [Leucogyrophana mollusca]